MKYPIYKKSENGLIVRFVGLNSGYAFDKINRMYQDISHGWNDHTHYVWRDLTGEERDKYGITETEKMRTKETIEKEIEALKKELESLPKGRWRAYNSGVYFYINERFQVDSEREDGTPYDFDLWKSGNYFKTKEEALKEARHREFEQKVTARFDELNGERLWHGHRDKCKLAIFIGDYNSEVTYIYSNAVFCNRNWVSNNCVIVEQIIEEFGAENFLKYARGEL